MCVSTIACALWLAATPETGNAREVVYVALGEAAGSPHALREGDPARIASRLEQAGYRVRLIDLTAAGAKVATIRETQLGAALSARPALVTLSVGPLDATGKGSLAAFSRELFVIADFLRRSGAKVVISTLPRASDLRTGAGPAHRSRVDAFNWAVRRIALRNGFVLADVRAQGGLTWESAVAAAALEALPPAPETAHASR
jgi:hypothetical protein